MTNRDKKFPHVSLYLVKGRYRLTTCIIDGRRITRRLGQVRANAERFAAKASDWIDQWKSNLIDTSKLLHLLGETIAVSTMIDRYKVYLQHRSRGTHYVGMTSSRIRFVLERAEVSKIGQVNARAIQRGIDSLRESGADGRPLSDQTVAHYVRAIRQFMRYCHKKAKVLEHDPITDLDSATVRTIVRQRREPTELEMHLLLTTTERLPMGAFTMIGADRSMLYAFAYATGLRAGELREVRGDWIDLERGVISVPKEYTKNGQPAIQPIPTWLVARARGWLSVKGNRRVWPSMSKMNAVTLRADQRTAREAWIESAANELERAERQASIVLKYKTELGYFDFHSFRHAFISRIVGAGSATVKEAQTLARHSTPTLTIGRYSHAEASKLRDKVDGAISDPFAGPEKAQAQSAAHDG